MPHGIGHAGGLQGPGAFAPPQSPNVGPAPVPLPQAPSNPFAGLNPGQFFQSRQQRPNNFFQNSLSGLPVPSSPFGNSNLLPQSQFAGLRSF